MSRSRRIARLCSTTTSRGSILSEPSSSPSVLSRGISRGAPFTVSVIVASTLGDFIIRGNIAGDRLTSRDARAIRKTRFHVQISFLRRRSAPLPIDTANGGDTIRAGAQKIANVARLNAADRDDRNGYGARDIANEWNARRSSPGMTRRLENGSRHAPRSSGRLNGASFIDGVNAGADRNLGRDGACLRHTQRMRCELNSPCAYGRRDVDTIVHDQPAAAFVLVLRQLYGEVVETATRHSRASEMHCPARAERRHHPARSSRKIGALESGAVGDGVDDREISIHSRSAQPPRISPRAIPLPRAQFKADIRGRPEG